MNKILLSTAAAAALVVVASGAHAADPVKLQLGGNLQEWTGVSSNTKAQNESNFDVKQDGEVKFTGSTKTDAGVTVSVEAALGIDHGNSLENRAATNSAAKRAFLTVAGTFGSFGIGEMENVDVISHNSAPDEGAMGTEAGFYDAWVLAPGASTIDANPGAGQAWGIQTSFETAVPAAKVSYFTPQFAGFQAGVDYEPAIAAGQLGHYVNPPSTSAGPNPLFAPANLRGGASHEVLTYGGNLGPVALKADIGGDQQAYSHVNAYNAGVSLGMNGFTLAGAYVVRNTGGIASSQINGGKGSTWNAGVGYENGPWGVSLSYINAKSKDQDFGQAVGAASNINGAFVIASKAGNDTAEVWLAGLGYAMAPGVKLTLNVFDVKWVTNDGIAAGAVVAGSSQHRLDQNKGDGVVAGLNVYF
jgi:hypothetical protein